MLKADRVVAISLYVGLSVHQELGYHLHAAAHVGSSPDAQHGTLAIPGYFLTERVDDVPNAICLYK